MLAMAFTLSCSLAESNEGGSSSSGGGQGGGNSFSYCLINGQCLSGPFTSKECGDLGGLPSNSNSCTGGGGNPSSSSGGGGGSVTYEGQTYKTVKIGTQTWMAENLNYDPGTGNSACYDNQPSNCATYGRLYDWSTAMALPSSCNESDCSGSIQSKHRGICPSGWHLPSDAEWTVLTDYVGGSSNAGTKLKATDGWKNNGNGTDEYGFSALPGGNSKSSGSSFGDVSTHGSWWSATEHGASSAYDRGMHYGNGGVGWGYYSKEATLYSVRCIQDNTGGGGNPSSSSSGQGDNPSSSSNGGQGGGGNGGPTNWTAVSNSTFGTSAIRSVAYGNNTWVAVGAGGNSVDGKIAYSTDNGRTWTEAIQTIFVRGGFSEINVVTFGNGMFIAASGAKIAYSTDGRSWMAINFPFSSSTHIRGIAYANERWVLVAQGGNTAYSTDGINWTAVTTDALSGSNLERSGSIVFNNNRFVAVCNGRMAYTSDGQSWTAVSNTGLSTGSIRGIAFGNNRYVDVGNNGMAYSTDGISWTAVTPNPGGFEAIAFGNNRYVAVGPNGRMSYSTDGTSAWTTIGNTGFGTTNDDDILDVAYGNGRFVAVGEQGQIAYAEW